MAVVACARRLRRAARRSAARALALAILTMLLGGGALHSTVVPEPAAPATIQIAEVQHHADANGLRTGIATVIAAGDGSAVAPATESATEPIIGHPPVFPGTLARTPVQTRAPPRLLAA
jgi:H+/gluconate symporter-like permease